MLGVHIVASIDADLYERLERYCSSNKVPVSRAVNNALSLYLTGQPRSEEPRKPVKLPSPSRRDVHPGKHKVPISVHIDVDIVVLLERYCEEHQVYLSSVVNRAIAMFFHSISSLTSEHQG